MKKKSLSVFQRLINIVLLFCFLILFMYITLKKLDLSLDFSILSQYRKQFLSGFVMTLIISLCTLILSLLVGIITAFGTNSPMVFLSYLCRFYVQLIRGTPLLVQIFFFYYIIGTAWGIDNRYIAGIIILSIFEGAYISEIIRGGLNSIDSLQYEISTVIGLNNQQRFFLVLLPQLVIRIMPALAGQFASIIKDSSLLSVIAVIELTQTTQEISSINYALFENYLFLGLLYFVLTLPVFLLSQYLEKRFAYAH